MNYNYKKILAREILIFFAACALVIICWGGLLLWNSCFEKKIRTGTAKLNFLEQQIDSMGLIVTSAKQKFQFPKGTSTKEIEDSLDKYFTPSIKLYDALNNAQFTLLKQDEFLSKYSDAVGQKELYDTLHQKEYYTKDFTSFKKQFFPNNPNLFAIENSLKFDKLKNEKSGIQNEISNVQTHILNTDSQKQFLFWLTVILFVLLYPARLIYFLIKWAIKTIKS